jgi:hypothetical protein
MLMKKTCVAMGLALLLLSGCGSSDNSTTEGTTTSETNNTQTSETNTTVTQNEDNSTTEVTTTPETNSTQTSETNTTVTPNENNTTEVTSTPETNTSIVDLTNPKTVDEMKQSIVGNWQTACNQYTDDDDNPVNEWGQETLTFTDEGAFFYSDFMYSSKECSKTSLLESENEVMKYVIGSTMTNSDGEQGYTFVVSDQNDTDEFMTAITGDKLYFGDAEDNFKLPNESDAFSRIEINNPATVDEMKQAMVGTWTATCNEEGSEDENGNEITYWESATITMDGTKFTVDLKWYDNEECTSLTEKENLFGTYTVNNAMTNNDGIGGFKTTLIFDESLADEGETEEDLTQENMFRVVGGAIFVGYSDDNFELSNEAWLKQ